MKFTQPEIEKMTFSEVFSSYVEMFGVEPEGLSPCYPATGKDLDKQIRLSLVSGKKFSWRKIFGKPEWEKARDRGEVIYV